MRAFSAKTDGVAPSSASSAMRIIDTYITAVDPSPSTMRSQPSPTSSFVVAKRKPKEASRMVRTPPYPRTSPITTTSWHYLPPEMRQVIIKEYLSQLTANIRHGAIRRRNRAFLLNANYKLAIEECIELLRQTMGRLAHMQEAAQKRS